MINNTWITYAIIAVVLLVLELIYFKVADACNIIDKPNERSSHKSVVRRGGGIILPVAMLVWLGWQLTAGGAELSATGFLPFIAGLLLVAGVSFWDDVQSLPDTIRLVVQFMAVGLMLWQWSALGLLTFEHWWGWALFVVPALIVCVGITNAYNFMDGVNGINGGYTLALLLPLAWLNTRLAFAPQSLITVTILADLVFCFFNYRPKGKAVCFAGDVGSVGSAFIVIFLLGSLIFKTGDYTYIVFLAVYGVDSVLTICHRAMLHENLGEAHRKHAYQLMANELGMEHTVVATLYTLLQLAICAGMILIPDTPAWHWGYLATVCLVLAVTYLLFMKKYYHLHAEYLASVNATGDKE